MPKRKKEDGRKKSVSLGDVQEQVGKTSSMLGVFSSYIFLVFSVIVGIALIAYGATLKDTDSQEEWILIGFGIFLIFIGIISVFISRFINKQVQSNRETAQGYAIFTELSFLANMFRPSYSGNNSSYNLATSS